MKLNKQPYTTIWEWLNETESLQEGERLNKQQATMQASYLMLQPEYGENFQYSLMKQ